MQEYKREKLELMKLANEFGIILANTKSRHTLSATTTELNKLIKFRDRTKRGKIPLFTIIPYPPSKREVGVGTLWVKDNNKENVYLSINNLNTPAKVLEQIQNLHLSEWWVQIKNTITQWKLPHTQRIGDAITGCKSQSRTIYRSGYFFMGGNNPGSNSPRVILTNDNKLETLSYTILPTDDYKLAINKFSELQLLPTEEVAKKLSERTDNNCCLQINVETNNWSVQQTDEYLGNTRSTYPILTVQGYYYIRGEFEERRPDLQTAKDLLKQINLRNVIDLYKYRKES